MTVVEDFGEVMADKVEEQNWDDNFERRAVRHLELAAYSGVDWDLAGVADGEHVEAGDVDVAAAAAAVDYATALVGDLDIHLDLRVVAADRCMELDSADHMERLEHESAEDLHSHAASWARYNLHDHDGLLDWA